MATARRALHATSCVVGVGYLVGTLGCGGIAVVDPAGGAGGSTTTSSASTMSTTSTTSGGFDGCDACAGQTPSPLGVVAGVTEASGLAASAIHDGSYYVHDDSGNAAALVAIDPSGGTVATIALAGATNVDWEDVAVGSCSAGSCIYVGDIGDNAFVRTSYQIYRVPEPSPLGDLMTTAARIEFVYPDGPHNAEALLFHEGALYIVTKVDGGPSGIYTLPADAPTTGMITVAWVGEVTPSTGVPQITAGDAAPFGILLRSYSNLLLYPDAGEVGVTLAGAPCVLPVAAELQGETVAWDQQGYVTLSEGVEQTLYRVGCR